MRKERLSMLRRERTEYHRFILDDRCWNKQRSALVNLHELHRSYIAAGIVRDEKPDPSSKALSFGLLRGSSVFGYRLHLLKLALLDNRPFTSNMEIKPCCFNRTNVVFLLGMIKNKPELVRSMLRGGFPGSINSPVLGDSMFPTYFQLACAMDQDILSVFLDFSPNYTLCWNGLTPQMIASFGNKALETKQPFDFVTMRQYRLLSALRGLDVVGGDEKPIFLMDFLCMEGDMQGTRKILDRNPELARVSKLCYLVQNSTEWILFLSRYQTSVHQDLNGFSPLHLSSLNGNFEGLVAFISLGGKLNAKDELGNTPMHYCAALGHLKCLELLIRVGGNLSMVNRDGMSTEDVLAEKKVVLDIGETDMSLRNALFQMFGDSVDFKHYLSIVDQVRYNSSHMILKKNRFTITSLLNLPHKIDYTEALIHKACGYRGVWAREYSPASSLKTLEEHIE